MRYPCLIQQDLLSKINLQVKCFSRFNINKISFCCPVGKVQANICELRRKEQRAIYFCSYTECFLKAFRISCDVSNTRD